jgi:hypothetical protein
VQAPGHTIFGRWRGGLVLEDQELVVHKLFGIDGFMYSTTFTRVVSGNGKKSRELDWVISGFWGQIQAPVTGLHCRKQAGKHAHDNTPLAAALHSLALL